MIQKRVIIVGGGPAGAACALRLKQLGVDCLILDKQTFPRNKLCAGWLTPQVFRDLGIKPEVYPLPLTFFRRFHIHIKGKRYTVPVRQYAIRRIEFDSWLLNQSGAEVHHHKVERIERQGKKFIIDEKYEADFLVGAGGTFCPVYKRFFSATSPRPTERLVVTMEEEFPFQPDDADCHLWFGYNGLPGYSWYVPKEGGYLNAGIGGYFAELKSRGETIVDHWNLFKSQLESSRLVNNHTWKAKGYNYYVRSSRPHLHRESVYLTGDAAGLATRDMGEGIGPAIASGILAADSIAGTKSMFPRKIRSVSFPKYQVIGKLLWALLSGKVVSE